MRLGMGSTFSCTNSWWKCDHVPTCAEYPGGCTSDLVCGVTGCYNCAQAGTCGPSFHPLHRVLAASVTTLAHHLLVHYQLPLVHLPLVTIFSSNVAVLAFCLVRSAIMANPQAVSFPKTVMIVPLLEFLWSMELMVLEAECQQQKLGSR